MSLKSKLLNVKRVIILVTLSALISACGGGGGGGGGGASASDSSAGGLPIGNSCGNNASSSYTINWDSVSDPDVTGYRVYHGLTSPISKTNSSFESVGNVTSWVVRPSDYGYTSCSTIYIAVASVGGSKGISNLSVPVSIVIE